MTAIKTREDIENSGINVIDEISWDDIDVLRPGMDFKNDVTYMTFPTNLNVVKTVGKGKGAKEEIHKVEGLACVTSERDYFGYLTENVEARGFGFPNLVTVPRVKRWSTPAIKEFIAGNAKPPSPPLLYQGIREVYETYVEFDREGYYDMMPIFVMGTYIFRLYKAIGYLHFNGSAASGKSQNLRILDALAFNTEWASSMSSAALYRSLAGHPGTVCIDEAEGWEGERGEELRRILNAGYLDGSTVKRAEKGAGDVFIVQSFETYGPKAIASINPLDAVIGSRCLIVAMRPALRTIPEFDKDNPRWQNIRDRLYLWAMFHAAPMAETIRKWNETERFNRAPNLIGRQWQITQMYVTIADYIDGFDNGNRCDTLIAFFNEYFTELQKKLDATDRIRLVLTSLPEVLRTKSPHDEHWYPLKGIHEVVSNYIEDDAKEYYKTRNLSKHLDVLGFKKRRTHRAGQQVWVTADAVRQEFRQRRVDPLPDDEAWLRGEVEYSALPAATSTPRTYQDPDEIWATMEEPENAV